MKTIYIEYIFLNNLAINYLICHLTLLAQRANQSVPRILFASVLGAAFSVAYPFMEEYQIIVKVLLSLAMVLLLKKSFTIKDFAVTIITFYMVSFIFAGASMLLADYINDENLLPFAVCGGVVLSVGAIRLLTETFYKRKKAAVFEYPVKIENGTGGFTEAVGYYDSGNKLTGNDNNPAVVISAELAKRLALEDAGELAVNTVAGVKMMKLVNLCFKIYYGKSEHKIYHAQAVVSDSLNSKDYQIILHRDMGGDNESPN
ncbi:MAG: sigma-E processing peptidase SpoIIGA [Clostridia bacterium]|nr:sigma-E processing peptidase SpoIIGA [Clostridia bacterium]